MLIFNGTFMLVTAQVVSFCEVLAVELGFRVANVSSPVDATSSIRVTVTSFAGKMFAI